MDRTNLSSPHRNPGRPPNNEEGTTQGPEHLTIGCGADRDRTGDLVNAIHALSQLSYSPWTIVRLRWSIAKRRCKRYDNAIEYATLGIRRVFLEIESIVAYTIGNMLQDAS